MRWARLVAGLESGQAHHWTSEGSKGGNSAFTLYVVRSLDSPLWRVAQAHKMQRLRP